MDALVWLPHFLQSHNAAAALRLDRDLWVDLQRYQPCFAEGSMQYKMVEEAMLSLKRHTWYFTKQLVVFAFWNPLIPNAEKKEMAIKLSNTPFSANFHKGKPKLPDNLPKLPRIPKLKDFIGPQSHLLFHLRRVGSNWLRTSVGRWAEYLEYQRVGEFLKHLVVVNDTAEQCIKDITE